MSLFLCDDCGKEMSKDQRHFDIDGSQLCTACRKERAEQSAERAWERQQQRLMEDGPPDTSREDQDLRDAGRGHLVRRW